PGRPGAETEDDPVAGSVGRGLVVAGVGTRDRRRRPATGNRFPGADCRGRPGRSSRWRSFRLLFYTPGVSQVKLKSRDKHTCHFTLTRRFFKGTPALGSSRNRVSPLMPCLPGREFAGRRLARPRGAVKGAGVCAGVRGVRAGPPRRARVLGGSCPG